MAFSYIKRSINNVYNYVNKFSIQDTKINTTVLANIIVEDDEEINSLLKVECYQPVNILVNYLNKRNKYLFIFT